MANEAVPLDLTETERGFLAAGLLEWNGPARATDELAVAMGFADTTELHRVAFELCDLLRDGADLTREQWMRALIATEFVFASDVFGSGLDWSITTGYSDAESVALLRGIQRKMPRWRASFQFDSTDDSATLRDIKRP